MKSIIFALFVLPLAGCAMFADEITRSAEAVGEGVDRYCAEVDQANRDKFRGKVNPTPGGASIAVTCPGD